VRGSLFGDDENDPEIVPWQDVRAAQGEQAAVQKLYPAQRVLRRRRGGQVTAHVLYLLE